MGRGGNPPKDFTHTHTKFSGRKHNMDMKSSARDNALVTPAEGGELLPVHRYIPFAKSEGI